MNKPRRKNVNNEKEFIPQTELGYLVKKGFIKSIDEIFDHSLSIKEYQIVDTLMGFKKLKEEVLDVSDVQKQCKAGQISSKKAVVVVGNEDGYIGVGT
ncbi:ribosomal prt S2, partial [Hepatospora eriocheir]